jgi:hypothetical protein
MIVFGTHRFGWVDRIEGIGTVSTLFFHVMYVPLIPLGSAVVEGDRGVRIGLSLKSVLVAWVRSFLFWSTLFSVVGTPATFGLSLCAAIPCAIGYFGLPLLVRDASPARAAALLREIGAQ